MRHDRAHDAIDEGMTTMTKLELRTSARLDPALATKREFDQDFVEMTGLLSRDRAILDLAAFGSAALSDNDR